jgi:hypothetical protein
MTHSPLSTLEITNSSCGLHPQAPRPDGHPYPDGDHARRDRPLHETEGALPYAMAERRDHPPMAQARHCNLHGTFGQAVPPALRPSRREAGLWLHAALGQQHVGLADLTVVVGHFLSYLSCDSICRMRKVAGLKSRPGPASIQPAKGRS